MDNHFHVIIGVSENHNISKVMQALLLSFSAKYRRKYGYKGYVWQGRFQSKPIMTENYMVDCINYIHFNPVKAGIVLKPKDYIYSSAQFYEGIKNKHMGEYLELSKYKDAFCHKSM